MFTLALIPMEPGMGELLHFVIDDETTIAVEVDYDDLPGFQPAAAGGNRDAGAWATETFTAAISRARRAAEVTMEQFKSMLTGPEEIEIELGIRLSAESGAVLAKAATEGHIQLRLTWRKMAE
jgi:hypothetical protein